MKEIRIAFGGDIFPGGILSGKNYSVTDKLRSYLQDFDIRIATLESPVGDDYSYYEKHMDGKTVCKNALFSKNEDLDKLVDLNINVVTIASNHVFDLGLEGLKNTIEQLKKRNILYCGAGINIMEASRPAIINIKGKSIAIIGCARFFEASPNYATEKDPGYNLIEIDRICTDIKNAKLNNDFVFVMPHWGKEGPYYPENETKEIALKMVEAGADGILGGHTHCVQPVIFETQQNRKVPIFFSLGHFLFPDRIVQPGGATFYPEKEMDISILKKTEDPYTAKNEYKLKIWGKKCRAGIIADISLTNKVKVKHKYLYPLENQVMDIVENDLKYRVLLDFFIKRLVQSKYYSKIYFLYEFLLKTKTKIYHPKVK